MTAEKKMMIKSERTPEYNISIIVPAYNAEATIQETLKSLLNQTLDNIEIICVDDGSDDSTPKLLSLFQSKYPDIIKVLTIPNQGVYKARSAGIEAAQGKYIGFCDSDDTIEPLMFETLFNKAQETAADLTICAYWRQDKNDVLSIEMRHSELSWCAVDDSSGWLVSINTAVWNKLFKASIAKRKVSFHHPPKITEDALFLLSLYPCIKRIAFVDKPLYHYFTNNSTAMKSITQDEIQFVIASWKELRGFLEKSTPAYIPIVDLAAFIHLGLSIPLIMTKTHNAELNKYLNTIRKTLNDDFGTFKQSRFLKLSYIKKHRTWMTLPFFASLLHRAHILEPALKSYAYLTSALGKDLKW